MCSQGGAFPAIDHQLFAVVSTVQQPETATAYPATVRLYHGQDGAHSNRGVKGITASIEDLHPGRSGQRMGTGDRLLCRPQRLRLHQRLTIAACQ